MGSAQTSFRHQFADRMQSCGTEGAFVVLAEAKLLEAQGRDIVHLQIGEPDFDTPRNIIDKAHWALDHQYTHYTPSAGLHEMRERYAEYVTRRYGVDHIGAEHIVIMPGAKPVIFLTICALVNPGDEVVIFEPAYPAYDTATHLMGGTTVTLQLREESGFRFDYDELESLVSERTKVLCLNSPQNPTGGVFTREDLQFIADLSNRHGFYVLSDEIYNRFVYEGAHVSMLHFPQCREQLIVLDGHSKTYAMTGWRLGFAIAPTAVADKLTLLMTNANSCAGAFTQVAGAEALLGDQSGSEAMIAEFRERRELIVAGLNRIPGISCHKPEGAFYVFPNVKKFTVEQGRTSLELQRLLLHEYGVACLAGTAFGRGGEGYLRLSYANSRANIVKALERLDTAFAGLARSGGV